MASVIMTLIIKCLSGNGDRQLIASLRNKGNRVRAYAEAYASLRSLLILLLPGGSATPGPARSGGPCTSESTYADAFDCIECNQNPHFWKTETQFTLRLPLLFDTGTLKTQAPAMLPSKNTNSGVGRNDFSLRQHCKITKSRDRGPLLISRINM